MKDNLLKVVLVSFFVSIILTLLNYFGLKINSDVDNIIDAFREFFFSFGVPLLIFCCLSRKNNALSNIGIFSIFLFVLLEIISFFILKYNSNYNVLKQIFSIQKFCLCLNYFIGFLKYLGILFLIDVDDDRGILARNIAIVFIFINEFLYGVSIWKHIKINSFWYNTRSLSFYLFEFFTMLFIAFKFWSDKVISVLDYSEINNQNSLNSIQVGGGTSNSIDVDNFVASGGINWNINSNINSSNVNNVSNVVTSQTTPLVNNINQPSSGLMSDFVVEPNSNNNVNNSSNASEFNQVNGNATGNSLINQNSSSNIQNNK